MIFIYKLIRIKTGHIKNIDFIVISDFMEGMVKEEREKGKPNRMNS